MSQEGWEVSFDGAANAFIMKNSVSDAPTTSGGATVAFDTTAGIMGGNDDTSIVTGLLPNVWGMTLKAPTANGLDMSARLGLYTHMNGAENSLGNGQINIRETSGSIAGFFGSVLVGRSLGIHQSNVSLMICFYLVLVRLQQLTTQTLHLVELVLVIFTLTLNRK